MATKLKKVFAPGEHRTLSLRVTNEARDRQPVRFELKDVPDAWDVELDRYDLVLDGGDDGLVKLSIRAPWTDEKQKVGMKLLTIPELEPDRTSEVVILAKVKPGKDGRKRARKATKAETGARAEAVEAAEEDAGGGLLGGLLGRGKEEVADDEHTVIRPARPRRGPPPVRDVVPYEYAPAGVPAGLFPASDFYYATHIPLDDAGTVLKLREQVQVVLRPGPDDPAEAFRARMDVDRLVDDLLASGYVVLEPPEGDGGAGEGDAGGADEDT